MTTLSIFLAKLIGLTFLIFGISLISKPKDYQDTVKDISKSNAIMTLISVIPLITGIAIVISHNIWVKNWIVVITVIGWLIFFAGIVRLFFHKAIMKMLAKKALNKKFFIWIGIILFIVGGFLSIKGFYTERFFL